LFPQNRKNRVKLFLSTHFWPQYSRNITTQKKKKTNTNKKQKKRALTRRAPPHKCAKLFENFCFVWFSFIKFSQICQKSPRHVLQFQTRKSSGRNFIKFSNNTEMLGALPGGELPGVNRPIVEAQVLRLNNGLPTIFGAFKWPTAKQTSPRENLAKNTEKQTQKIIEASPQADLLT